MFSACSDWSVKVDLYVVKEKEGKVMAEVGGGGGEGREDREVFESNTYMKIRVNTLALTGFS